MLTGGGEGALLVSLPGRALMDARLEGNVFGPADLAALVLPPDLRRATQLVEASALEAGRALRFVARPEMFTHGPLLEALAERAPGVTDHLALSDGTTCRLMPGLRNHLFFYRRADRGATEQLRRLAAQAPETFMGLASQVNGTLALRVDGAWHRPPASSLRLAETPRAGPPRLIPLLFHPGNPYQAARMALAEVAEQLLDEETAPWGEGALPILYVPLSEAVLADLGFMEWLARRMLRALMSGTERIILELGGACAAEDDELSQTTAALAAIARTGVALPRALFDTVQFSAGALPAAWVAGATVLVHPGLDFWRLGDDVWQAAGSVAIAQASPVDAAFAALLRGWMAPGVEVQPLHIRPPAHRVRVSRGV